METFCVILTWNKLTNWQLSSTGMKIDSMQYILYVLGLSK